MKSFGSVAFPLALVALLAALTFWLERAANPEDPARKAQNRHDPDSIGSQIDVRHFDISGGLKQVLLADTMTHYPDDDSIWIVKPQLTLYRGNQTTQLLANAAQVSHDDKQIFLSGNVRLINQPPEARLATTLQTEALTVFPDDNIAQGNTRATILHGDNIVSGDSIRYDGKSNITILAGRVKGTFYRVKKS